ncbi:GntR family transcriptional regulator [Thalassobacillus devorans]|uniref:GntR family transcriptional regulator n=1 Tax=Thalassobacillus devorans TaxID=279813 RepID=UPI000A1CD422|nr:GntR family transcriptional regulator [Thalassobacillus devorans]
MAALKLQPNSPTPVWLEIVHRIKEEILKNERQEGDPLPSVRELASRCEINPNTIMKAYSELERQQAIYIIKGKGAFVAQRKPSKVKLKDKEEIEEKLKCLIIDAAFTGIEKQGLIDYIDRYTKQFHSNEKG